MKYSIKTFDLMKKYDNFLVIGAIKSTQQYIIIENAYRRAEDDPSNRSKSGSYG